MSEQTLLLACAIGVYRAKVRHEFNLAVERKILGAESSFYEIAADFDRERPRLQSGSLSLVPYR